LNKIEPTIPASLPEESKAAVGAIFTITPATTGYTLKAKGSVGNFEIVNKAGALEFNCTKPSEGGCPTGGHWDS
jgi:hypothetical protein